MICKQLLRAGLVAGVLSALLTVSAFAATYGGATVTEGGLRLRAEASTDSSILTSAAQDDVVIVLEDAAEGWYKVSYNGTTGYMSADYLTASTTITGDMGYGVVQSDVSSLNVRSGPDSSYDSLGKLSASTTVEITGIENGWYMITSGSLTGYASSDYIDPCSTTSVGGTSVATSNSSTASALVAYAKTLLGSPYVYGASGPYSFDCSGFTSYVFSQFGYSLNRSAAGQTSNGTYVSMSELQAGDLILFRHSYSSSAASHAGIYIGNGQFIHASTNSYKVIISDLAGYYSGICIGGRRIL